jgi:hypothetical protein
MAEQCMRLNLNQPLLFVLLRYNFDHLVTIGRNFKLGIFFICYRQIQFLLGCNCSLRAPLNSLLLRVLIEFILQLGGADNPLRRTTHQLVV